jgi:hypothetical protein
VRDGRVLPMNELRHLALRRRDHPQVTVAGACHPDAGGEVEVASPVLTVEVRALAANRHHAAGLLQQRR